MTAAGVSFSSAFPLSPLYPSPLGAYADSMVIGSPCTNRTFSSLYSSPIEIEARADPISDHEAEERERADTAPFPMSIQDSQRIVNWPIDYMKSLIRQKGEQSALREYVQMLLRNSQEHYWKLVREPLLVASVEGNVEALELLLGRSSLMQSGDFPVLSEPNRQALLDNALYTVVIESVKFMPGVNINPEAKKAKLAFEEMKSTLESLGASLSQRGEVAGIESFLFQGSYPADGSFWLENSTLDPFDFERRFAIYGIPPFIRAFGIQFNAGQMLPLNDIERVAKLALSLCGKMTDRQQRGQSLLPDGELEKIIGLSPRDRSLLEDFFVLKERWCIPRCKSIPAQETRERFCDALLEELYFWQLLNQLLLSNWLRDTPLLPALQPLIVQYVVDTRARPLTSKDQDLDRIDRALVLGSFAEDAEMRLWSWIFDCSKGPALDLEVVRKFSYIQSIGVKFTGKGAKRALVTIQNVLKIAIACCAAMQGERKEALSIIEASSLTLYTPLLKRIFSATQLTEHSLAMQNRMLQRYQEYCEKVLEYFPALKLNTLLPLTLHDDLPPEMYELIFEYYDPFHQDQENQVQPVSIQSAAAAY